MNLSTLDLFVGKNKIERWCMDDFKNDEDLQVFKKELHSWLMNPISEIEYESGNVYFVNSDTKEVIFAYKKIFSFFWPKRIKEQYDYEPWIKI